MKNRLFFIIAMIIIAACSKDDSSTASNNDGQGGSMATFTLKGEYLYVVDELSLNIFKLNEQNIPSQVNSLYVGFDIETLFGFKDYLYIGSRNGMYIYNLEKPEFPEQLSAVQHFTACDPVVANDTLAFVTLHSNQLCGTSVNALEIYDTKELTAPIIISRRNLISPKGLRLKDKYLFVCDDEIKIFDISDPKNSKLVNSINISAVDVIIKGDVLMAIGDSGVYQYNIELNDENVEYTKLSSVEF